MSIHVSGFKHKIGLNLVQPFQSKCLKYFCLNKGQRLILFYSYVGNVLNWYILIKYLL